ncbi:MAG: SusE domain-containing protein, partial [Bacteroidales bacterium]|nr:SusE domain-containing protein [Bacteroidales bacterium]
MKKLTIIFLLFIGLGFILSCEKELRDPKLDMNGTTNPAITNPQNGTAFILTEDEQDNVFTNFQWSATGYSLSNLESTKYELSMDEAGSNFADPDILTITTDLNFEMTVLAINQRLITRGLGVDTAHDMEFKLRSYVNDASDYTEAGSEVTTLSLTPYEASAPPPPTEPTLWIPGDYQGWSPETAPVIYSYTDDGVFKGYMWMPEGGTYEFKFTSAPDWDHTNFGFAGEGLLDPDANAG